MLLFLLFVLAAQTASVPPGKQDRIGQAIQSEVKPEDLKQPRLPPGITLDRPVAAADAAAIALWNNAASMPTLPASAWPAPPKGGSMKYFAAFLKMLDPEKSQTLRPQHLAFLEEKEREGRIFARGRFVDGAGGLVVYMAESLEKARGFAENDPYVIHGARGLEMHEWDMTSAPRSS